MSHLYEEWVKRRRRGGRRQQSLPSPLWKNFVPLFWGSRRKSLLPFLKWRELGSFIGWRLNYMLSSRKNKEILWLLPSVRRISFSLRKKKKTALLLLWWNEFYSFRSGRKIYFVNVNDFVPLLQEENCPCTFLNKKSFISFFMRKGKL